jgi:hypothetical protein
MSLGKFLKRLWAGIASLFHKVDEEVKKLVPITIDIVQQIKLINDTHIGDVITAIIPGHVDDQIREKLTEWLPATIINLGKLQGIANIEDTNEKLKAILAAINVSDDDTKKVFYHGLASLILERLSDGKFDWSDATAVAEYYYQHELANQ